MDSIDFRGKSKSIYMVKFILDGNFNDTYIVPNNSLELHAWLSGILSGILQLTNF